MAMLLILKMVVPRQTRQIPVGNTYVDGGDVGNVGDFVLRDRKQFAEAACSSSF